MDTEAAECEGAVMEPLQEVTNTSSSGWCPGCGCGWHKAIDAFDVTPPEAECKRLECDCHNSYWDSDPVLVHQAPDAEDELMKRWRYGDR
jgi:hypothetical protein